MAAGFLLSQRLDALIVTFYSLNEGGDREKGIVPKVCQTKAAAAAEVLYHLFCHLPFPNRSTTTFNSILLFIWHGGRKFVFFNSRRFESEYGT